MHLNFRRFFKMEHKFWSSKNKLNIKKIFENQLVFFFAFTGLKLAKKILMQREKNFKFPNQIIWHIWMFTNSGKLTDIRANGVATISFMLSKCEKLGKSDHNWKKSWRNKKWNWCHVARIGMLYENVYVRLFFTKLLV